MGLYLSFSPLFFLGVDYYLSFYFLAEKLSTLVSFLSFLVSKCSRFLCYSNTIFHCFKKTSSLNDNDTPCWKANKEFPISTLVFRPLSSLQTLLNRIPYDFVLLMDVFGVLCAILTHLPRSSFSLHVKMFQISVRHLGSSILQMIGLAAKWK